MTRRRFPTAVKSRGVKGSERASRGQTAATLLLLANLVAASVVRSAAR